MIKLFRPLNLFLLFLFTLPAKAQILKISKGRLDADSSGYLLGNLNFDININNQSATANEEAVFRGITAGADLVYIAERNAYILINKVNYFSSTGGPFVSTGYAHFRINFARRKKLSYLAFSQVQYDNGRRMPFRALLGGGLKYPLLRNDKSGLYASIGIMREKEKWKAFVPEGDIIVKDMWKTTNFISGHVVVGGAANLNVIAYYQGGWDGDDEVFRNRTSGDLSLDLAFNGKPTALDVLPS